MVAVKTTASLDQGPENTQTQRISSFHVLSGPNPRGLRPHLSYTFFPSRPGLRKNSSYQRPIVDYVYDCTRMYLLLVSPWYCLYYSHDTLLVNWSCNIVESPRPSALQLYSNTTNNILYIWSRPIFLFARTSSYSGYMNELCLIMNCITIGLVVVADYIYVHTNVGLHSMCAIFIRCASMLQNQISHFS